MRPIETILILLLAVSLILLVCAPATWRRWRVAAALAAGLLVVGQLVVEGYRWQMIPAYLLSLGLAIAVAAPWSPKPLTTIRSGRWYRKLLSLAGIGVALLFMALAAALPLALPVFRLPRPGGPHPTGTTWLYLVDSQRPETFTDDAHDRRQLAVQVWYPATPDATGQLAPYWTNPSRKGAGLAQLMQAPSFVFDHLGLVRTHSRVDAPLAGDKPYPVLLFSHGYGGAAGQSTFLMEELASRGYVVFSVDHPYEALPVEFPDGTVARPKLAAPDDPQAVADQALLLLAELHATEHTRTRHAEILQEMTTLLDLSDSLAIWVDDLAFTLDEIERRNSDDGPFRGKLDLGRIGVFGHSFGGAASVQLCARDPRCRAAINLDGSQFGSVAETGVDQPLMLLYSEPSRWMNHAVSANSRGPAYQLTIRGSRHMDFSDMAAVSPLLRFTAQASPVTPFGSIGPDRMFEITGAYVAAFFDKHLLGRESPLLEGNAGRFPEVDFERKPAADPLGKPAPAAANAEPVEG